MEDETSREDTVGRRYPTRTGGPAPFVWVVTIYGLLLSLSLAVAASSQVVDRVSSGQFGDASSLSDWEESSVLMATEWSGTDWDGSLSSGSAVITFSGGSGTAGALTQCLQVEPGRLFRAAARTYVESGQAVDGYFNLYLRFFDSADCTVPISHQQGLTFTPGVFDTWGLIEFEDDSPMSAQSVLVMLRVFKASGEVGDDFSAFVDDVTFVTGEDIFKDGFETGNTSEWSAP